MCVPSGNGSCIGRQEHRLVGRLLGHGGTVIVGLHVTREHKIVGPCDVDRLGTLMVILSPCYSSVGPASLS